MENIKTVRIGFQVDLVCPGLDIKDAFLHVSMRSSVKKFLRFTWKGKLYEWQVLPFNLKCSLRIMTFMENSFFVSFMAEASAWWPTWKTVPFKQDTSVRQSSGSMWLSWCSCAGVGQLIEGIPFSWPNLETYLSGFSIEYQGKDFCLTWGQNHPGGGIDQEADCFLYDH